MCGRYAFWADRNTVLKQFDLDTAPELKHSWNVAPSLDIPVVRQAESGRELVNCRWGLVPHWARDARYQPINARAETLASKPFFRDSYQKRRCLIPANGFYEWQKTNDGKQPWFIRLKNAELFAFAGLWSHAREMDRDTAAIITTTANDTLKPLHARMPVILAPEEYEPWLAEGDETLLRPCPLEMEAWPISTRVNNPHHDSRDLLEPV